MKPADPEVFEDTNRTNINITEKQLLGEHIYENVLYTGNVDVTNVLTGEKPKDLDRSVEDAKSFVQRTSRKDNPPRVAKSQSSEKAIESRSPYTSTVFFHFSITGSMEWHTVFKKAWESEYYKIRHVTNYETGTLKIIVSKK